jgi:hypothetical protein
MPLLVVFSITWLLGVLVDAPLAVAAEMRARKIVNRKSATALGVTVAPSVLLQAGEVIE